jgi:hypothetical protein
MVEPKKVKATYNLERMEYFLKKLTLESAKAAAAARMQCRVHRWRFPRGRLELLLLNAAPALWVPLPINPLHRLPSAPSSLSSYIESYTLTVGKAFDGGHTGCVWFYLFKPG